MTDYIENGTSGAVARDIINRLVDKTADLDEATTNAQNSASSAAADAALSLEIVTDLGTLQDAVDTATSQATISTTQAGLSSGQATIATAQAVIATTAANNAQASARTCATWSALNALTGTVAGQGAEVLDSDAGTHTDPVVGGTVSNSGRYTWSASPAGWQRIGGTGLSGKADNSVVTANTRLLTNTLVVSLNLFNKDDANYTTGWFVNHTTGNLQANANYDASGFIPVTAGLQYFIFPKSFIGWYNASGTFISGSSNADTANVQTAPAGAAQLRISLQRNAGQNPATAYVVQGNTALSAYEAWGGKASSNLTGIGTTALNNGTVTPLKTNFLVRGKNLFNKATVTPNTFAGADGAPVSNAQYFLSDFIEVEPSTTYRVRGSGFNARFSTAYDATFNVVAGSGSNTNIDTINVPASGVKYYKVTGYTPDLDSFQFEKGSSVTSYEPYGYSFTSEIVGVGSSGSGASAWASKTLGCLGDSLTQQANFLSPAATAIGVFIANYGSGGTRVTGSGTTAMCNDARINAIPTTVDAVHFLGGTNDWANEVALGASTSADVLEFYGALNVLAQKLAARFPTKPIFWATVPLSAMTLPRLSFSDTYTNGLGLTIRDYNDAVWTVAQRWGFAVIDYGREAGFNQETLATYMTNDGNLIHPNSAGGKRMASVMVGRLRDLEPIA